MAEPLRKVVEANKAGDVIEVIHGKAEEVELPEKADVLVSEWMGFYLLHESMLDSVIAARNKHLDAESGMVLPSRARIWCVPCCRSSGLDGAQSSPFSWDDVYGFDMSALRAYETPARKAEPRIDVVRPEELMTEPRMLREIDLRWVEEHDVATIHQRYWQYRISSYYSAITRL